jgi:hypothetical protein
VSETYVIDVSDWEFDGGSTPWPARIRRDKRRAKRQLRQIITKVRRRERITSSPAYRWEAAKDGDSTCPN